MRIAKISLYFRFGQILDLRAVCVNDYVDNVYDSIIRRYKFVK